MLAGITWGPEILTITDWGDERLLADGLAAALRRGGEVHLRVRQQRGIMAAIQAICRARRRILPVGIDLCVTMELIRRGDHISYWLTVGARD